MVVGGFDTFFFALGIVGITKAVAAVGEGGIRRCQVQQADLAGAERERRHRRHGLQAHAIGKIDRGAEADPLQQVHGGAIARVHQRAS